MSIAVGIDLGTTNSCVAVYINNEVAMIENEEEESTIPSFIYFDKDKLFIGKEAIHRSILNAENSVFDSKRMLGYKFDDKEIQNNLPKWPFTVTKTENGEPQIVIKTMSRVWNLRPEEVSAIILAKLKKLACDALEATIVDAVITVPAYFTNAQKQATKDAARLAKLNVLKLISEPTAAAFAFIGENKELQNPIVLVYDLGGGTFDVSLIKFHNNNNEAKGEVLSTSGDDQLGRRDFDNNLLLYKYSHIFSTKLRRYIISAGRMRRRKEGLLEESTLDAKILKRHCHKVRRLLYRLLHLKGKINAELTITRAQFETLNKRLFERTIAVVDEVLKNANITKDEVDEVLLVGGSTRIPKIQQMVGDYFGGKALNKSVNPDEAVARGAAIQASLLSDIPHQETDNYFLIDVTPFSLGIEVAEGMFSVIIERNTRIPASTEKGYRTTYDNQTLVIINVYEGESEKIQDNVLLGEFEISDITPKPKGEVEVYVRFEVDANGILNVNATESSKKITKDLNIVLHNGSLTEEQIEEMQARIGAYNDDDYD